MPATYVPSGFTAHAMLCDSVAVSEGKFFIQGGGWNILNTQAVPFAKDRVGFAAVVSVPYNETNRTHTFELKLEDQDGNEQPLGLALGLDGVPVTQMKLQGQFTAGRPPLLQAGDAQVMPIGVNLDNLPFTALGAYSFVLTINGEDVARLPFRIQGPMGVVVGS
jgi:hypothetical protein